MKLLTVTTGARVLIKRLEKLRLFSSSTITNTSSDNNKLVLTTINEESQIATLTMNRKPVNSLSLELCEAISESIQKIESSKKAKSIILTSSNPIFSAGLDLLELYQPREDRLRDFWKAVQQVYFDLYGCQLATIACITGPAPAAGCMLAMACDYRIMSREKGIIGLNEAQFGLIAPSWMADLMVRSMGYREAEKALMMGTLYSAENALKVGLVDEVVTADTLVDACEDQAKKWNKIPLHSRFASKMLLRKKQLDYYGIENRLKDEDDFVSNCLSEQTQDSLGSYLKSLQKKDNK